MMRHLIAGLCLLLTAPISQAQSMSRPITHIPTDKPYVAITFDDGPDATHTPQLLDLFKQENAKVTFFVLGRNVKTHPDITRRIIEEGHELGNHSYSHPNLPQCETLEEVRREIVDTQNIITQTTGTTPTTFRAPYLAHDDKVWAVLQELKLPSINASKSTNDWDRGKTAEDILAKATENLRPGDIILMHSWRQETLDVMPEILRRIQAANLEPVTLQTLLAVKTPAD